MKDDRISITVPAVSKSGAIDEDPRVSFKIKTSIRLSGSEYPVNKITTDVNEVISKREREIRG